MADNYRNDSGNFYPGALPTEGQYPPHPGAHPIFPAAAAVVDQGAQPARPEAPPVSQAHPLGGHSQPPLVHNPYLHTRAPPKRTEQQPIRPHAQHPPTGQQPQFPASNAPSGLNPASSHSSAAHQSSSIPGQFSNPALVPEEPRAGGPGLFSAQNDSAFRSRSSASAQTEQDAAASSGRFSVPDRSPGAASSGADSFSPNSNLGFSPEQQGTPSMPAAAPRLRESARSVFPSTPNQFKPTRMVGAFSPTPRKDGHHMELPEAPSLSEMMHSFDFNAMIRGAQLTVVGAYRALQNPKLFTSQHYRHVALAILAGLALRVIVSIPILMVRLCLWGAALFVDLQGTIWDENLADGLEFIEHSVLQVPFFMLSLMRHITPTLDQMFMDSLAWVDHTYVAKHRAEDPANLRRMYYDNLQTYPRNKPYAHLSSGEKSSSEKRYLSTLWVPLSRSLRRGLISLAVYAASFIPYIGPLVLPGASFLTFRKAVGTAPASVIFASGLVLPKKYLVIFLQTYFSSRSLMRQLLEPYFTRIMFNKRQKAQWFKDRAGVLFGFSLAFYLLLRIPFFGVLVFGIAEASTAYLLTKITEPPPPCPYRPSPTPDSSMMSSKGWSSTASSGTGAAGEGVAALGKYIEDSLHWPNKHKFLSLPISRLDDVNVSSPLRSSFSASSSRRFDGSLGGGATTTGFLASSRDDSPFLGSDSTSHLPSYDEAQLDSFSGNASSGGAGVVGTGSVHAPPSSYAQDRDRIYGRDGAGAGSVAGTSNRPSQISRFAPGDSVGNHAPDLGNKKYS